MNQPEERQVPQKGKAVRLKILEDAVPSVNSLVSRAQVQVLVLQTLIASDIRVNHASVRLAQRMLSSSIEAGEACACPESLAIKWGTDSYSCMFGSNGI